MIIKEQKVIKNEISIDDNGISSTNILKFIENFENDDESWIDEINRKSLSIGGILSVYKRTNHI